MATTEMGVVAEHVRCRWYLWLAVLAAGVLIGAMVGRSGPPSYRAAATVRMQYPRSLETVPLADDFAAWLKSDRTVQEAAARAGVKASAYSIGAAVPPSNKRLVNITVTGSGRGPTQAFLDALIVAGRRRAEAAVAEQMSALRAAAAANKKALDYSRQAATRAQDLQSRASGDPLAEATALSVAMQASSAQSSLLQDQAQVAALLSQLERGVEIDSGPTVSRSAASGGPVAGAIRGAIVAGAAIVVWLLAATRRERAALREI